MVMSSGETGRWVEEKHMQVREMQGTKRRSVPLSKYEGHNSKSAERNSEASPNLGLICQIRQIKIQLRQLDQLEKRKSSEMSNNSHDPSNKQIHR